MNVTMTNGRNLIVLVLLGLFLVFCDANEKTGSLRASTSIQNDAEMNENSLQSVDSVESEPTERRLISFWALFMALPHPCLPHHHHCDHSGSGSGGDGNGGDGGDGNGQSGASAASDGSGASGSTSSSSGIFGTNVSRSTALLMAVAAAAAAAALIAAVVGQRRNREERHSLSGSVSRRMNLFNSMCNGNLCGDRPDRVVEMRSDRDYQLA